MTTDKICDVCNSEYDQTIKVIISRNQSSGEPIVKIIDCDYCPKCGRYLKGGEDSG